jgi:tetraacyldisaccharide 4'-kinase
LDKSLPLSDHQAMIAADFDWDDASLPVIMTAKDAVRCAHFARSHWWALEVTTEIDHDLLLPVIERIEYLLSMKRED